MKAYVLPGAFYGACVSLMAEAGFQKADKVSEADVVVFIGGADIDPNLYNQGKHPTTHFINERRDNFEVSIYHEAQQLGKICFGICRGAQFLHAMNGGELWQNVNNHAGPDHEIIDIEDDVIVTVTSLHHQMLQINPRMEIVAVCNEQIATSFEDDTTHVTVMEAEDDVQLEIEAGKYADTRCFFVQGHPEVGNPYYRSWTMTKLQDFIMDCAMEETADNQHLVHFLEKSGINK